METAPLLDGISHLRKLPWSLFENSPQM